MAGRTTNGPGAGKLIPRVLPASMFPTIDRLMRYQGTLVKWNEGKGFGFISPKGGGQPVFVHANAFANRDRRPALDNPISFTLGSDTKGRCCAVSVRYLDESQRTLTLRFRVWPMLLVLASAALLTAATVTGTIPGAVGIAYLALSLLTFWMYASDKLAAEKSRQRTPENTLLLFGLAGGWPGAILAQQLLRHKSSKKAFLAPFWLSVIMNSGALLWLISPAGRSVRVFLAELV